MLGVDWTQTGVFPYTTLPALRGLTQLPSCQGEAEGGALPDPNPGPSLLCSASFQENGRVSCGRVPVPGGQALKGGRAPTASAVLPAWHPSHAPDSTPWMLASSG